MYVGTHACVRTIAGFEVEVLRVRFRAISGSSESMSITLLRRFTSNISSSQFRVCAQWVVNYNYIRRHYFRIVHSVRPHVLLVILTVCIPQAKCEQTSLM